MLLVLPTRGGIGDKFDWWRIGVEQFEAVTREKNNEEEEKREWETPIPTL